MWSKLTHDPDFPDRTISSFIAASHHQLIVAKLRHGEVHEVPACDVDFPIDVAGLSEHDLKTGCSSVSLKSSSKTYV